MKRGITVMLALAIWNPRASFADGGECDATAPLEAQKQAAALTDEAFRLHTEMRFFETAEKYREAARHWNRADIHLQAGVAYLSALRLLEAFHHISIAIRCGERVLSPEDMAEARNKLRRLRERLTELEIRTDEAGAEVLLNNEPWFTGAGTQKKTLIAGQYVVTVKKPGHITVLEPVLLEQGQRTIFVPTVMSEREGTIVHRRFPRWLPWTVAGVGAASLATGLGLRVRATNRMDDYEQALDTTCADGCLVSELAALDAERARAGQENVAGVSLLAVGGATLAAGLTMAFLNRPTTTRHPDAGKGTIEVVPMVTGPSAGPRVGLSVGLSVGLTASGHF